MSPFISHQEENHRERSDFRAVPDRHRIGPSDARGGGPHVLGGDAVMREIVFKNLNHAVEGGYGDELATMTAQEIVVDLQSYAPDCERATEGELLPHVEAWLVERSA